GIASGVGQDGRRARSPCDLPKTNGSNVARMRGHGRSMRAGGSAAGDSRELAVATVVSRSETAPRGGRGRTTLPAFLLLANRGRSRSRALRNPTVLPANA